MRLLSAPVAAQIADRFQHPRAVLTIVLAILLPIFDLNTLVK